MAGLRLALSGTDADAGDEGGEGGEGEEGQVEEMEMLMSRMAALRGEFYTLG